MANVNYSLYNLTHDSGFVQATVPEEFREDILKEIEKSKANNNEANHRLVAAIHEEYSLPDLTDNRDFTLYLDTLRRAYHQHFDDYIKNKRTHKENFDDDMIPESPFWVNYQKKNMYNPPHLHSGLFSFVMWVKVPYDIEEEKKIFEKAKEFSQMCSFSFLIPTDNIAFYPIDVSKKYEWEVILFPSYRYHMVTPFYTSDEYRISVAGNLTLPYW